MSSAISRVLIPACVQVNDLIVEPGEAPPILADQYRVEPPLPVPQNRQLQLAGVGNYGLAAVAVAMIAGVFLHRSAQMMVHLGIQHPLRQPLLQFVDQPAALEHRCRVATGQQLIHHLVRDPVILVRRHTLPPALPGVILWLEHEISDTL
jgi:hypothetical protein